MKRFLLMALAMVAMSVAAQNATSVPFTVRYIDENRLFQQYVVAQQYLQLQSKLRNDYQQAEKKKRDQIETFYNQVQNKYKNGQYKTQKAFEADQKKLEQMQTDAQKEMDNMKNRMEQQLNQEQRKLANEIDLFLADYAIRNGYDAILRKESAMFINPKWDVTNEVAEGLNARYNALHAPTEYAKPEVDGDTTPTQQN
ncbi:MAG: OmpH family outer membrane protein [Muribaculaceae bacterium]|nr:OmpH family outer membrane protein [Muribaculaceae bacterium]